MPKKNCDEILIPTLTATVIGTVRSFHLPGCSAIRSATNPREVQIAETLLGNKVLLPCRVCIPNKIRFWWYRQVQLVHRNCRPYMPWHRAVDYSDTQESIGGRPRSLTESTFERVLSLHEHTGMGSRAITRELRASGVDVSRATVQRALQRRGVYQIKRH